MQRPFKTYNGGKNGQGVFQSIINQIPVHDVFITAFAGNCGVLANKLPAKVNIVIDCDTAVINGWKKQAGVIAIKADAGSVLIYLITKYCDNGQRVFVFLDPPYLQEVRRSKKALYRHEMNDITSHKKLVELLSQITESHPEAMMMLTHYPSQFYDNALKGWRKLDIVGRSRKGNTIERLYMNYDQPNELHDIRYFGSNYRERELLSKAAKKLKKKFQSWTPLQKQYFMYRLNDS